MGLRGADKKLMANQPGNVVVDKQQKEALVIDVKATVVPVVI